MMMVTYNVTDFGIVNFWEGWFIFICYHSSFFLSVYSEIIIYVDSNFDKCDLLREGRVFYTVAILLSARPIAFLSKPLKKNKKT